MHAPYLTTRPQYPKIVHSASYINHERADGGDTCQTLQSSYHMPAGPGLSVCFIYVSYLMYVSLRLAYLRHATTHIHYYYVIYSLPLLFPILTPR